MRKGKTAQQERRKRALVRLQDDLDSMNKQPENYMIGSIPQKEREISNLLRNIALVSGG